MKCMLAVDIVGMLNIKDFVPVWVIRSCVSLLLGIPQVQLCFHMGRIASAKVCFLRAVLFVIFQETTLPFYKSLQTDLGDLSAAGKCSENSGVQFIPFSAVEISAVDKIEKNVFLVVCLMQTVPLFIL